MISDVQNNLLLKICSVQYNVLKYNLEYILKHALSNLVIVHLHNINNTTVEMNIIMLNNILSSEKDNFYLMSSYPQRIQLHT